MATIRTTTEKQTRDALYRLVGQMAVVTTTGGASLVGTIVGTPWRDKSARGVEIMPTGEPGTRLIPFGEVASVTV